jgi:outer membrane receptor protein involved in Fe transport
MNKPKAQAPSSSRFLALVLALSACAGLLFAGETGKIVGKVTDANTGEPIAGAVIEVEGSELGANTETDGRYSILSVPAGTWNLRASATGFADAVKTDILVYADQSVDVNFKLGSKVYQMDEVVTQGERPMVIRTAVQTTRVVTNKEFSRLPVSGLGALVGLQAGVTQTANRGWTHIRGGRYNDVSYLIDGVSAKDALVGTLWSSPRPTQENIEAVEVITGSFDAEYGEAMSGVIQTVTREGGDRTSSRLRYTTDEMFPNKDLNFGYNLVQWTLGGPLFMRPLRYFVSAEYFRTQDDRNALYQVKQPRNEYTIEGKVNYSFPKGTFLKGDNLKIILDGHHSNYEWHAYSQSWKYHLNGIYANRVRSYKTNLRLNYLPSGSNLLELAAGIFDTRLLRAPRDYQAENEDTIGILGTLRKTGLWNRYVFKSENWVFDNPVDKYIVVKGDKADTIMGHMPRDVAILRLYEAYRLRNNNRDTVYDKWAPGYAMYDNPYGVPGTFVTEGQSYFHYRSTYDQYFKGSYTYTPNKVHELKTGVELKRYTLSEYTNSMPYDYNPFYERYSYEPVTAAAYVQDKADFEDLVVRAGLRFDYLDAKTSARAFPESTGGSTNIADSFVKVGYKMRLSPRLGLSYPITDRIKFRFSYGHFFRNPDFSDLYASQLLAAELNRRGNIVVGNPNLSAEKTVGYEMGFDAQLTDYFQFDFTAFYKDVYDLSGVRPVPAVPMGYATYYNVEYARIQGFEATMAKALSQYWSARLSYTLTIAKGTASTSFTQYGSEHPVQVDYYLDQDQRHAISFDVGLTLDRNFKVPILRNIDLSLLGRYGSGLPYSPTNRRGEPTGQTNSARMPDAFTMDARFSKTFKLGPVGLNIVCDAFNLLNTPVVYAVYSATGKPDFDGAIITINQFSSTAYQLGDPAYHPGRDANHDGYVTRWEKYQSYLGAYYDLRATPLNFGPSRKVRFGVSLSF